jgi:hypothetical protein
MLALKKFNLVANPPKIQFFTWDALQEDTSWWLHFENQIPRLAELGFTQVWLPPMNKAAQKASNTSRFKIRISIGVIVPEESCGQAPLLFWNHDFSLIS